MGGALIGSRLGPLLLADGSHSPYAPLFALIGALMLGALLASGLEVLGFHLRRRLPEELGPVDGVGGGILVACLGLFLVDALEVGRVAPVLDLGGGVEDQVRLDRVPIALLRRSIDV